jgi:hypothetical protein
LQAKPCKLLGEFAPTQNVCSSGSTFLEHPEISELLSATGITLEKLKRSPDAVASEGPWMVYAESSDVHVRLGAN